MAEHTTTTPNGLVICFEDGEIHPETGKRKRRKYEVAVHEEAGFAVLPSVTTILGILDKPGLRFAAEKLAIAGAVELASEGALPLSFDRAYEALKEREMLHWQQWAKKADRGTVTHEELVRLATGAELADLDTYPPEQRGFLRGAADWYAEWRPEAIEQEVMVASVEHGFAGRHDFFGVLHGGAKGRTLLDLKTQEELPRFKDGRVKPPYREHLLQLALYEVARCESGYESSDLQAVVRIDSTGAHDTHVFVADPDQALAVVGAYKALRG